MAVAKGMDLDAESVARAVGLLGPKSTSVQYPSKTHFNEVTTDSRTIKTGQLFVALRGATYDGHAFIEDAIRKGAKGVICEAPPAAQAKSSAVQFCVGNTLAAYRKLAGDWRSQFEILVVAVAGSVGKTSTKDILAALLSGKYPRTLRTEASQNGDIGIPATLLKLRPTHQAAVVEVGIDAPGMMTQHIALVRPTLALLTAIAPEHLEKLVSLETVAAEELKALTETLAGGGRVAFNLDDELIKPHFLNAEPDQRVGFTMQSQIRPRPEVFVGRISVDGLGIEVSGELGETKFVREKFELPLPGRHNATNLLGAIVVGVLAGLTPQEMRAGLKHFKSSGGRSQIERLPSGSLFVCDWYNASPASMSAALDLVKEQYHHLKRRGSRIACLGDMLELGKDEETFHRKLAEKIAAAQIDYVLLYGSRMKWLADELSRRRFDTIVHHHETHEDLVATLKRILRPDDVILIKGSRGMQMEKVWSGLN